MNSRNYTPQLSDLSATLGAGDVDSRRTAGKQKRKFTESFERFLILTHRWIAIIISVLFIVWYVSGFVMGFSSFPLLTHTERLNLLPTIAWQKVSTSPAAAIKALGLKEFPKEFQLQMAGQDPVYMITGWDGKGYAVSAETGRKLPPISGERALEIVKQDLHAPDATLEKVKLPYDQWTVSADFAHGSPYHLIALNDTEGSEYYVSTNTGELAQKTTAKQRIINWFGTVPHWLYFAALRHRVGVWAWVVDILASFGVFVVLSGIWLGIKRIRIRQKYPNSKRLPFSGWKWWHAVLGLTGGLSLAFWMITGLGAMYPGGFLEGRSLKKTDVVHFRGTQSPSFPAVDLNALGLAAKHAKNIVFGYVGGAATISLEYTNLQTRLLDARTLKPIDIQSPVFERAVAALDPGSKVVSVEKLPEGDDYWYSNFDGTQTLPITRAIFSDGLWFYMKAGLGTVVSLYDGTKRVDRWTNDGWHSLNWHWGKQHRPWWVALLFATMLPGLAISVSGLVIGVRRLKLEAVPSVPLAPVPVYSDELTDDDWRRDAIKPVAARRACIVYSSQSGTAEELAGLLQTALTNAGMETEKCDLVKTSPTKLATEDLALFVIATTGEGDPPDRAIPFARKYMQLPAQLGDLVYAVLALGDTNYSKYAQFGLQVDAWLARSGANRLFRAVTVHSGNKDDVDTWVHNLERSLGKTISLNRTETFTEWRLIARQCVNTGSIGAPIFRVSLAPVASGVTWLPGEVVRIKAGIDWAAYSRGEDGTVREYSIASLPGKGEISLFVRLAYREDGTLGTGSGWLADAAIGTTMALRVRSNPGFTPAPVSSPAIFIGNGTGYAGLSAHILQRVQQGQQRNWLIFGERNRANDYFCREDVDGFTNAGGLELCHLVFSRDQPERVYVQDMIRRYEESLRSWVEDGAYIFVCGSQHGMAPGVDQALREVLGDDVLTQLTEDGRYRRDVYYE